MYQASVTRYYQTGKLGRPPLSGGGLASLRSLQQHDDALPQDDKGPFLTLSCGLLVPRNLRRQKVPRKGGQDEMRWDLLTDSPGKQAEPCSTTTTSNSPPLTPVSSLLLLLYQYLHACKAILNEHHSSWASVFLSISFSAADS